MEEERAVHVRSKQPLMACCAQVWKGVAEDFGAGAVLEQKLKSRRGQ